MTEPASAAQTEAVNADLWSSSIFSWSTSQTSVLNDFRQMLRSYDCRLAKYLADVRADSPGGGFRRHDVNQLEKLIIKGYGQSKCLPSLRILDNIIVHLNRVYQKSIPRPQLLKSLEQANVFLETSATAQSAVHQWLLADSRWAAHILSGKSAAHTANGNSITPTWEMVIASAALHCGIDDLTSAVALVDAMCNPQQYFACSLQRDYCDLPLIINSAGERIFRRWYPNEQLIRLISRVSPDAIREAVRSVDGATPRMRKREIGVQILKGILAQLVHQGVAPQYLPSSFPSFLAFTVQAMRSELEAILTDFAAGKMPARSLLPPSMGRITGDPVATAVRCLPSYSELPNESAPEQDLPKAYAPETSEKKRQRRQEPDWMRGIRQAFQSTKPADIEQALSQLKAKAEAFPPVAKQLISLARKLMKDAASTGNEWAPSSVKCCVLTVARRFALERRAADPAQYESETLEEIYSGVVANAASESRTPARLQRTVAWALREYQRHIVCCFGANCVNEGVAFRYPSGPVPVDARIISLDDLYDVITGQSVPIFVQVVWSFLISARILIRRLESLKSRLRALPFGSERRNISMTC